MSRAKLMAQIVESVCLNTLAFPAENGRGMQIPDDKSDSAIFSIKWGC